MKSAFRQFKDKIYEIFRDLRVQDHWYCSWARSALGSYTVGPLQVTYMSQLYVICGKFDAQQLLLETFFSIDDGEAETG